MGWWQTCEGCVNCADELVIDRIWQRGSTYRARVRIGGDDAEWTELDLPAEIAERVIADLRVALADLRKLIDN